MQHEGNEVHLDTDAARAGSTPHIVRWILGISLFAVIVLLSAVWITGALTQGDVEGEMTARKIAEERAEGGGTGGLVGENADEIEATAPAATEPGTPPRTEN